MSKRNWDDDSCEGNWFSRFSPLAIAGMIAGGIVLGVLFAFLFGWVVMLLWNWLMPEIFGLPVITYWQGWGLVILSSILLKGGFHGGDHDSRRKRKSRKEKWVHDGDGWRHVKEELAREFVREAEKEFGSEGKPSEADKPAPDGTKKD